MNGKPAAGSLVPNLAAHGVSGPPPSFASVIKTSLGSTGGRSGSLVRQNDNLDMWCSVFSMKIETGRSELVTATDLGRCLCATKIRLRGGSVTPAQ